VSTGITDPGHRHLQGSNVTNGSNTPLAAYGIGGPTTDYGQATGTAGPFQEAFTETITTGITASSSASGGLETRPINAYCNYIIKT
jgi:hypothetical protein